MSRHLFLDLGHQGVDHPFHEAGGRRLRAAGKVPASDVVTLEEVETLEGGKLGVKVTEEGGVYLGDANVVNADIMASNGVIHVIDSVLLPEGFVEELNRR